MTTLEQSAQSITDALYNTNIIALNNALSYLRGGGRTYIKATKMNALANLVIKAVDDSRVFVEGFEEMKNVG